VLEVLGVNLMLIHTLPGGLWEIFIAGVWLIARGCSAAASGSEPIKPAMIGSPVVGSATA